LSLHPAWLPTLRQGFGHRCFCLEACSVHQTRGFLALSLVNSPLFGRFLVSLPYLNHGGILAESPQAASTLVQAATALAHVLQVRFLELRQDEPLAHPLLIESNRGKVNMRLELPASAEELWNGLDAKVRNQIRKARKLGLTVEWGCQELLQDFYAIFSGRMRDLGTPVYGQSLFEAILDHFPDRAEIGAVRAGRQ